MMPPKTFLTKKVQISEDAEKMYEFLKGNIDIRKKDRKYWMSDSDVIKLINNKHSQYINWLPSKYFNLDVATKIEDKLWYDLEAFCKFIKYSVNDPDLRRVEKRSENCDKPQKILSDNPHYVVDYHEPLKWQMKYHDQVNILVDIIKITLDQFGVRGYHAYELVTDFFQMRCDYYISTPIPLIINIQSEDNIPDDDCVELLTDIGYKVITINAKTWQRERLMHCDEIYMHIRKYQSAVVLTSIINKSEEIKEIVETFGEEAIVNYSSGFPFSLSKVLQLFGIKKNNKKYKEIWNKFDNVVTLDNISVNSSESELTDSDDSCSTFDSKDDSDNSSFKSDDMCNDIFIENKHYSYSEKDKEIYINYNTLIFVGASAGTKFSRIVIDKMWELIEYINESRSLLEDVIKNITLTDDKRKKMYDAIKARVTDRIDDFDEEMEIMHATTEELNIEIEDLHKKLQQLNDSYKKLHTKYISELEANRLYRHNMLSKI